VALENSLMKTLFFIIALFFSIHGSSRSTMLDTSISTDTVRHSFFLPEALTVSPSSATPFIVTPDGFHNYNPNMQLFATFVNDQRVSLFPYYGKLNASSSLGNLGTPSNSIIFFRRSSILESRNISVANIINNSFDTYLFGTSRMRNYEVKSPLTELYFIGGDKKEQLFQVLHTQNINPYLNMGVEYRTFGSEGFYQRQETKIENFRAFLSAKSKDNRYRILAHSIWNSVNANENGGILDDSLFEKGENITKSTIAINLLDAHSQRSQQAYFLQQSYDVGKSISKAINDSAVKTVFIPKHRYSHTILYQNWSNYFIDNNPDSSNYVLFLNDPDYTSNHTYSEKFTNKIDWNTLNDTSNTGMVVHSGLIYEINKYKQDGIDSNFNNLFFLGAIGNQHLGKMHWKLGGGYCISGGNQGDLRAIMHFDIKDSELHNQFNIDIGTDRRSPSLIQTIYRGNHFQWENNFDRVRSDYLKLAYMVKKYRFNLSFTTAQIQNFIYSNELALPEQDSNKLNVLCGTLVKDFKWRNIGIKNTVVFQRLDDSTVLHLPSFLSYHALYFEGWIFKKALFLQMGVDVFFNTTYYADEYMPATGLFYLQSRKEIGNYPYLNFFINFKVNQARVFFKIAHLNQGYLENTYYSVPHYPMADRSFKLGISWLFYD